MTHSPTRAACRTATTALWEAGLDRSGPSPWRSGVDPSEAQWSATVEGLAKMRGWRVWHARDSRRQNLTDWPDLTLAHWSGRLVLAELKRADGLATPGQAATLLELAAGPAEVYLWRPADWPHVEEVLGSVPLRRPPTPPSQWHLPR